MQIFSVCLILFIICVFSTETAEDKKSDDVTSKVESILTNTTENSENDSNTTTDATTEISTETSFDILQVIINDAQVIEKRKTRATNDNLDLEVAADTVFRPRFVYKKQKAHRKFRPFPLF